MTNLNWKKWLLCAAAFMALTLGATFLYRHSQSPSAAAAAAEFTISASAASVVVVPATDFVSALGRLEPQDRVIRLSAPPAIEGARVAHLLVSEGDTLSANQVVAVLDGQDRQAAAVTEATRSVEVARSKLAQVKAGAKQGDIRAQGATITRLEAELRNARDEYHRAANPEAQSVTPLPEYAAIKRLEAELEHASVELRRAELLMQSGVIAQGELDTRRTTAEVLRRDIERARAELRSQVNARHLAVETAQGELERGRATLASLAEVRPTDVRAAEAEVGTALAAAERAQANLAATYVRAMTGGRVLKINVRPGESIGVNGILELGETDHMYVVAEVFEADIVRVEVGQAAEVTLRSMNQTLQGVVAETGLQIRKRDVLSADPVAETDARVVEVRIRLTDEASKRVAELTNARVDVRINVKGTRQ